MPVSKIPSFGMLIHKPGGTYVLSMDRVTVCLYIAKCALLRIIVTLYFCNCICPIR